MNCLQCQKSAVLEEITKIRTCEDGHRTVLLTKKQERVILKKIKEPLISAPLNELIVSAQAIKDSCQDEHKEAVGE